MSTLAVRGRLLLGTTLVPGTLLIEEERIARIRRAPDDGVLPPLVLEADIVAPGFIDLQVNGGFGVEIGDDPAAIRCLARRLPETGVTAFLPTVITSPSDFYARAFQAFASAQGSPDARPLGLHVEGPFLSELRAGAHRRDLIAAADGSALKSLLGHEALRLLTLAPERPEAVAWIRRFRREGVVVSLGHTNASFEQFEAGVDAGATMGTHLYNAMSPFQHRAPGAIGASLLDDRVVVGLIADGIHTHPASLELARRSKQAERLALVTDMVSAAGMPPGRYELGGRTVVRDETSVRLENGTLAGSVLTMDGAVRNMLRWTEASPSEVLLMATAVPARVLGLQHLGRLEVGSAADLVLLSEDFRVQATLVKGKCVYRREEA